MKKNGFTLIELLLSVLVIGVLVGTIIVVINPAKIKSKARDAQRIQDLKAIQSALEVYFADNGRYPGSGAGCVNAWESIASTAVSCLRTAVLTASPPYLRSIPNDPTQSASAPTSPCSPSTSFGYTYYSQSTNRQQYVLTAHLENTNVYPGTVCASLTNWSWASCGAPVTNCYGVQSPQ